MVPKFGILFAAAGLVSAVAAGEFNCAGINETGVGPACCKSLDGNAGTNCVQAEQTGGQGSNYDCKASYKSQACCNILDKNPDGTVKCQPAKSA